MKSKEKWFIFFAMLSVFLICGEYATTRPTSNALFLTQFSSKAYPWVWLATVPLNLFAIYLYNRFLPKSGPLKVLFTICLVTICMNISAGYFYENAPWSIFIQYAWKDIYVLLMLKQLWSMIHSTIPEQRAKYIYGSIYGVGTIGAILGSLIPSQLVQYLGSEKILMLTLPFYLVLLFSYSMALKNSKVAKDAFEKSLTQNPSPKEAVSLIRKTPTLMAVLLLVIFMQVSVALMEYQFNANLEIHILDKDLRTAFCGKVVGMINMASLFLQFIGGFLLIHTLGLKKSHFLVPVLLCSSALFSIVMPSFAVLSFSYIFFKSIDFSLFGVIREMLYVPLELDAKFRAKAIIDVFAYRTSKAFVSLGLLALQLIAGSSILQLSKYLLIAIFAAWIVTVMFLFRKKEVLYTKTT